MNTPEIALDDLLAAAGDAAVQQPAHEPTLGEAGRFVYHHGIELERKSRREERQRFTRTMADRQRHVSAMLAAAKLKDIRGLSGSHQRCLRPSRLLLHDMTSTPPVPHFVFVYAYFFFSKPLLALLARAYA